MERQSNPVIEFIYESLKNKLEISELEEDILDSIKELNKEPIDRNSLIFKIRCNISKYNWLVQEETLRVSELISNGFKPKFIPYEQSADIDLLEKLYNQIIIMFSQLK